MWERSAALRRKLVSVLIYSQSSFLHFEDTLRCQVHVGCFCYFLWEVIQYRAVANWRTLGVCGPSHVCTEGGGIGPRDTRALMDLHL